MIAMQYKIPLPADYEMSIIRQRVQTNGATKPSAKLNSMRILLLK